MFITFRRTTKPKQLDFQTMYQHLLDGIEPTHTLIRPDSFFRTYTINAPNPPSAVNYPLQPKIMALKTLVPRLTELLTKDIHSLYYTFHIPKRKGGLRRIDAPLPELKTFLRDVKELFEHQLLCLAHDTAYAYVKGRSTKEALMIHQENQSKWFLKLDIQDFFPSCTPELIKNQLLQLYPFSELYKDQVASEILDNIIKLCTYEGHLPQGTPLSPLLTNLIMIPYDYQLQNTLYNTASQTFKYTRYADDLLISCRYHFDWKEVQQTVQDIITPFKVKIEKTRYGSANGRNWNLGLMLNKDNQITIGHTKKHRLKAILFNFFSSFTNEQPWSIIDTQVLMGNIAYFRKIEPEYTDYIIQRYAEKFNVNFSNCIKEILNP